MLGQKMDPAVVLSSRASSGSSCRPVSPDERLVDVALRTAIPMRLGMSVVGFQALRSLRWPRTSLPCLEVLPPIGSALAWLPQW